MLRATLKRNLVPILLISLGSLILLVLVIYLFRAQLAMVGWVLFGALMIAAGVVGVVLSRPRLGRPPTASPPSPPSTMPPLSTKAEKAAPWQQNMRRIPRPLLSVAAVLVICMILALLCNLALPLLSLLTVRDTRIVDCREAPLYAARGWQFVSSHSYSLEDATGEAITRTDCVLTYERFVWSKPKPVPSAVEVTSGTISTPLPAEATVSPVARFPTGPSPVSSPTIQPQKTTLPTQTPRLPVFTPSATAQPLPTSTPYPPVVSMPTATALPSATPSATVTPFFTLTPTPSPTPQTTETQPSPSPTSSPIPRTDLEVCEAQANDRYLDTYVQWKGRIVSSPSSEDEGLWFQVEWENPNPNSSCQAIFFVSYDTAERFFEDDIILVTGTISKVNYEYEGETGQTAYAVVVRADRVELLSE